MRKTIRTLALLSVLSGVSFTANAVEVRGLFNIGYDVGGDSIVTVLYNYGPSESVDANKGIFFGAGVSLVWDKASTMETQLTLNYKFDETDPYASGGVKYSTTAFDAVQVFNVNQVSFGVGLTYHMSPEVTGTGIVSGNLNFDDATGLLFQLGYRLSDRSQIGMRYTNVKYKGSGLPEYDGSGIGFYFNFAFGGSPARGDAW